ncbi:MAG: YkgJ family cysteine cluster protein [Elusimicrobiota bacterium]|nr:YkgJ family cysteine cluster protein [Elusimicrobiota bacterium]
MFNRFAEEFKEGNIEFNCCGCGNCCREEGHIAVTSSEINAVSAYFSMSKKSFLKKHVEKINGRYYFNEEFDEPCKFLKDGKCLIYPVRPAQCRTFPYWGSFLRNTGRINDLLRFCEGMKKVWIKWEENRE